MRSYKLLLALSLVFTALAFTVPRESGKAGPPGEVVKYEKAVNVLNVSTTAYEFVGNVTAIHTDQVAVVPAQGIKVLKETKPSKATYRVVKRQDKVPRLSTQVRLIQKIPPLMA